MDGMRGDKVAGQLVVVEISQSMMGESERGSKARLGIFKS